ncbi:SFXN1-like protein [Mya arenaria]|uniref:SFXN1-like protein n=1 Tax=Mya arenaria TaxID=6604 RepID=A0ABY7FJD9_MYAAR|nr:SFXN1-like protein [Mya arenaria]
MTNTSTRINLDEPRYDQSTFSGRAKHFVITTNPFNIFATSKQLDEAKSIVERYSQLALSYTLATGGAVGTALTINKLVKRFPPIVARFVPFTAVAAANCINIPCMRSRELIDGIPVFDANGNRIGDSKRAAESAIAQSDICHTTLLCIISTEKLPVGQ